MHDINNPLAITQRDNTILTSVSGLTIFNLFVQRRQNQSINFEGFWGNGYKKILFIRMLLKKIRAEDHLQ